MQVLWSLPKSGTTFHRHSPDSVIVSQHLTNATGQGVVIDPIVIIFATYVTGLTVNR